MPNHHEVRYAEWQRPHRRGLTRGAPAGRPASTVLLLGRRDLGRCRHVVGGSAVRRGPGCALAVAPEPCCRTWPAVQPGCDAALHRGLHVHGRPEMAAPQSGRGTRTANSRRLVRDGLDGDRDRIPSRTRTRTWSPPAGAGSNHSGRAVAIDRLAWVLYTLLQIALILRLMAAATHPPASPWLLGAAGVRMGVAVVWAARHGRWMGMLRADGRAD